MAENAIDLCATYLWSLLELLVLTKTRVYNVKQIKKLRLEKAVDFHRDWEDFVLELERRKNKLDFRKLEEVIGLCSFILLKAGQFEIDVPKPSKEVQREFDLAVPPF